MPVVTTAPYVEHYIPVGQGNVYARDYPGADPAFVLMHGFPDNLRIYDDLIPLLAAAGRRVVAFDFLGFGQSDKPDGATYSFEQQRGDLKAVVDYLDLPKIVPVAHDASGGAAVNFAIDHPDRVSSLVVLNAAFAESQAVKWPEMIELFATGSLDALTHEIVRSPAQFGWLLDFQRDQFKRDLSDRQKAYYDSFLVPIIDDNFRRQPGAGAAFVQMTAQFYAELARNTTRIAHLEALDVPVRIIWGENDPYINAGVAREFQSHLKHSSLCLLPAGHWVQLDEPELVAKDMLS
jgi:pimeloyl-ACP methyl ester carboxylesterase